MSSASLLIVVLFLHGGLIRGTDIDAEDIFNDSINKLSIFHATSGNVTTCYGRLGCIATDKSWYGPFREINLTPLHQEEIDTTFHLYTRNNLKGENILVGKNEYVSSKFYKPHRETKFIIHGYLEKYNVSWVQDIMQSLLVRMDINVIAVDYSNGAKFPYHRAVSNARVVGLEIAYLIKTLIKMDVASADRFHLIGHSLGSHVAGYAGERIPGLGRITGLDPAGPLFTGAPTNVRLDPSDAILVDVIHTDITIYGFGYEYPLGHMDFYPNGGEHQPGCLRAFSIQEPTLTQKIKEYPTCNHARSVKLFLESITSSPLTGSSCPFIGFKCKSYERFLNGDCTRCSQDGMGCALMGLDADQYPRSETGSPMSSIFYLNTNALGPYCGYHYALSLTVSPNSSSHNSIKGNLAANVFGETGMVKYMDLTMGGSRELLKGMSYDFLGFSSTNAGHISSAEIRWIQNTNFIRREFCPSCTNSLFVSRIEIHNLGFYPHHRFLKSARCLDENVTELKSSLWYSVWFNC